MWFGSKQKWTSGSFFKECRVCIFLGGHKKDNFFYFMANTIMKTKKSNFVAFSKCMNFTSNKKTDQVTGRDSKKPRNYVLCGAAALKKRRCVTAEQRRRQPCLSCPVLAMMKPLITKLLIQSGD